MVHYLFHPVIFLFYFREQKFGWLTFLQVNIQKLKRFMFFGSIPYYHSKKMVTVRRQGRERKGKGREDKTRQEKKREEGEIMLGLRRTTR